MDKKFTNLKIELINAGLSEKNFEYLYNAIKSGTKRELIFKNLTSDVRKVNPEIANISIEKMYKLNGGEFKYENRSGYLYSAAYSIIAIAGLLILISFLSGYKLSTKIVIASALLFFGFSYKAITTILKTVRGKYRDE